MFNVITAFAGVLFVLAALIEVTDMPVAWWGYAGIAVLLAVGVLQKAPIRSQRAGLGLLAAVLIAMVVLRGIDWNIRKPFLRDLDGVMVGMTETEVRQIMGKYIEGTGWPTNPFDMGSSGTLVVVGSDKTYATKSSPSGELLLSSGTIVYRHSRDGNWNSDWGIVKVSDGRVVSVQFSAD